MTHPSIQGPLSSIALQSRCDLLDIRSSDGASVRASCFETEASAGEAAAAALIIPGMGVPARYYEPFARALAARGWTTATMDLRGQGQSSERPRSRFDRRARSFGYRHIVTLDLPAAVDALRACRPDVPLLVIAHSLGGQLAFLSTEGGHIQPDGLVLVAAGTAHWRGWPRGDQARALVTVAGIALAAKLLPRYPGSLLGFGGDQPRELMTDWSQSALTGSYGPLEPERRTDGPPVLALGIEGDMIAPPEAIDSLTCRLARFRVRRQTLPSPVGSPWRRHFSWVREPRAIVERILAWHELSVGAAGSCSSRPECAAA